MIIRSFIAVILLLGVGFIVGVAEAGTIAQRFPAFASMQSVQTKTAADLPVRCADEVSTIGWQQFQSIPLGFTLLYPPSVTMTKTTNGLTLADGSGNTIALTKMREDLSSAVDPSMQQGSWKIADRNTYALTTPYVTNDDGTLTTTYLFVRNFPQRGTNGNYDMVQAAVTLRDANEESSAAHSAGILDPETVLNVPEQILSTFRFLQNDEINPKAGGE